jgi:hypothetical protein
MLDINIGDYLKIETLNYSYTIIVTKKGENNYFGHGPNTISGILLDETNNEYASINSTVFFNLDKSYKKLEIITDKNEINQLKLKRKLYLLKES